MLLIRSAAPLMPPFPLALAFVLAIALAPAASAITFSYDGHYTNYYDGSMQSGLGNGFPQSVYINTTQTGPGKAGEFDLWHNVTNCSLHCSGSLYASNSPSKLWPYALTKLSAGPSPSYAFANLYVGVAGPGTSVHKVMRASRIKCSLTASRCQPHCCLA